MRHSPNPRSSSGAAVSTAAVSAENVARPVRVFTLDDHELVRAGIRALLSTSPDVQLVGEAEAPPRRHAHAEAPPEPIREFHVVGLAPDDEPAKSGKLDALVDLLAEDRVDGEIRFTGPNGFIVVVRSGNLQQAADPEGHGLLPPLRRDPAFAFEPVQRRIQRSMLHLQHVVRRPLNVLRDRVSVRRPGQERSQNEQIERPLQQLDTFPR